MRDALCDRKVQILDTIPGRPDKLFREVSIQTFGIPGPGARVAVASCGVMLQVCCMRFNQFDAVKQRGMNSVNRLVRKVRETIQAIQPVTCLLFVAVVTAIAGRLKYTILRTTFEIDFFQYKQSRIG